MKKKSIVLVSLLAIFLITLGGLIYIAYPFLNAINVIKEYENKQSGEDRYGNSGWKYYEVRKPNDFVMTNFDWYNPKFTLVFRTTTEEAEKREGYSTTYDYGVFMFSRNSILTLNWDVRRLSYGVIKNKPFDQVVELAKKTDIGMINWVVTAEKNGNECAMMEGQPGMYKCRRYPDDPAYDPDISTYLSEKETDEVEFDF